MTKMGTVWDRTTEVLSGRGGMLAGIAALTLFLPTVVQNAIALALGAGDPAVPASPGAAAQIKAVSLLVAIVMIFGQLAIVAAASDPATGRGEAFRIARARLLPAIGILLMLVLVFLVLCVPFAAILAGSNVDIAQLQAGNMTLPPGTMGMLTLAFLVVAIFGIWLSARIAVLIPVIVNERLGLRSYPRSFALTRGMTWRLIGFILLFGVVAIIAGLATQMVSGVVFRLILGADRIALALFLAGIPTAVLSAAITVVYSVFTAQLYVARRDEQAGIATF